MVNLIKEDTMKKTGMKFWMIIVWLCCSMMSMGQQPSFEWVYTLSGPNNEGGGKICSDENFTSTELKKITKFKINEIKLNTEFFLSYNYFVLNNMKEYGIIKSPIGILPRTMYKKQ